MRKLHPARKLAFGLTVTAGTVLSLAVAAAADSEPVPTKLAVTKATPPTRTPPTVPGTVFGVECGEDEVLVPFDVPIYDPVHGWWVIGWETAWFCVPEDLEPAG
jgi:hypothetical protein